MIDCKLSIGLFVPLLLCVVSFSGDGDFLMCGQEIATARQYDLNVVFIVVNNGIYGTIRMHQEKFYPGRVSGTDLVNPDFAALGRAYGLEASTVEKTEDFADAFDRARAAGGPSLIEVRIEQDQISPRATLSALRAAGFNGSAWPLDRSIDDLRSYHGRPPTWW